MPLQFEIGRIGCLDEAQCSEDICEARGDGTTDRDLLLGELSNRRPIFIRPKPMIGSADSANTLSGQSRLSMTAARQRNRIKSCTIVKQTPVAAVTARATSLLHKLNIRPVCILAVARRSECKNPRKRSSWSSVSTAWLTRSSIRFSWSVANPLTGPSAATAAARPKTSSIRPPARIAERAGFTSQTSNAVAPADTHVNKKATANAR